jgi:hypothetical protein
MAYTDFTLERLGKEFDLRNQQEQLFTNISPIKPSPWLSRELQLSEGLPLRTEKARSEWIVAPILKELREQNDNFFTIYSGENLSADSALGLNGECDFVLAKDVRTFDLNYPIISIVEAKRNDIEIGVPQCAAQLLGAKIFNEKRGVHLEKLYGCVTTGREWLFMELDKSLRIDTDTYYLNQVDVLLGIFTQIISYYRTVLP